MEAERFTASAFAYCADLTARSHRQRFEITTRTLRIQEGIDKRCYRKSFQADASCSYVQIYRPKTVTALSIIPPSGTEWP